MTAGCMISAIFGYCNVGNVQNTTKVTIVQKHEIACTLSIWYQNS